ncbi:hypothetical protein J7K55_01855 [Candidatus Aerophobetes bacterium]|nr:hypothetical protein [Candidatus Aerophobetes bacterium]
MIIIIKLYIIELDIEKIRAEEVLKCIGFRGFYTLKNLLLLWLGYF